MAAVKTMVFPVMSACICLQRADLAPPPSTLISETSIPWPFITSMKKFIPYPALSRIALATCDFV